MTEARRLDHARVALQAKVCRRFGGEHVPIAAGSMVGVSERSGAERTARRSIGPLHGLRHPPEGQTNGWYLWTGDLSPAVDFFVPWHVEHLIEMWPEVVPYLALAPGWRVLLAPAYEDVWFDETLLDIGGET